MTQLSLALLGPMQISLGGQPVGGITYHKARALLAYLAVEAGRPHHRDALAALLWPELPDDAARHNLRQALANLRAAIGDASAMPPFLLITRDSIQLNPASNYALDVAAFTALLTSCATHPHRSRERCRSCAARMEQAITLYRGDFLAEFNVGDSAPFEEWQLRQRERLHQQALDALTHLAGYHERRGEDELGRRYAQRQIALEPWREEAHRQLMRLLAHGDQRSAALAQYETCCRVLAEELGVGPEAATTTLYEQIRDRETRRQGDKETRRQGDKDTINAYSLSPPLLVSPAPRHNFPAQPTLLIGRETELSELGDLLENPACRLITIVGPGGIGKTRLALAAGAEQADVFADGAAFVSLQAISSAAFLAPAILAALAIPLQGQRDPREQLLDHLRGKELLLVLDNLEQLLAPDQNENASLADLLVAILARAPSVTLLVTSRERLALPGEWLFDLSGLHYPSGEAVDDIEGYSAVRLFMQRAGQVRRQFALAFGEARAVAQICRLVEGLPLAIELAAAALRTRSCAAIADAIATSLSALAIELRAVPERQRSMWATFEYSWRLLSDEERQVFARLSVFRGGFQEDAAAMVARASPQLLAALLDKSLLRWDGAARYDLHELVRQFASEKLEQAGETEAFRRQHAEYYLALAESAETQLNGAQPETRLVQLEQEHANLGAALIWRLQELKTELGPGVDDRGDIARGIALVEQGIALAQTAGGSWGSAYMLYRLGDLGRSADRYARARALLQDNMVLFEYVGDSWGRAQARGFLAKVSTWDGDFMQATALLEQNLALNQAHENKRGCARTFKLLADVEWLQGNYARAAAHCQDALTFYRVLGDRRGIANTLHLLGDVTREQGEYARAIAMFEQCQVLYRDLDDLAGIAGVCGGLGDVLLNQGHATGAAAYFQQALTLLREFQHHEDLPMILRGLGRARHEQGDDVRAIALLVESLTCCRELGLKYTGGACLAAMAGLWVARGQPMRAARLFGASEVLRGTSAAPIGAVAYYTSDVANVRAQLDEATFAAAWAEGAALTLEQAIAYALEGSAVDVEQPGRAVATAKHSG